MYCISNKDEMLKFEYISLYLEMVVVIISNIFFILTQNLSFISYNNLNNNFECEGALWKYYMK